MRTYLSLALASLLFFTLLFALAKTRKPSEPPLEGCYDKCAFKHEFVLAQANTIYGFSLLDPEQAPPDIRDSVMRGYRLIMNTPFYAPNYAHDQLSCTNCHFVGGDTLGGRNNGISLVGVTTEYPSYSKRDGKVITLADRINNCFQRSMNGNPLPKDSQEMHDILTYLHWISKEVEHLKDIPWLGLQFLKSKHNPDPKKGEELYHHYCASCHRQDGDGGGMLIEEDGKTIPPLWGSNSFNDGAGMNRLDMLASFIYWNMPYQNSVLTEEQALDIASFIRKQPRDHFEKK
ncbi:c-type cytochrome [Candidatus Protochlamydia phocaeensis]|uniref:c-type cytochrome n=1 Tax=Candidatus Protochlamydia phocaeensis TaxID=1414722 RepID=UPI0008398F5E|nr:c-type cytochrome [Candidatus Protochlamydia phocaeensis]